MEVDAILMILGSFAISLVLGIGAIAMIRCVSFKEAKSVAVPWLILSVINISTLIGELIW